jgi:hypothetical protein
VIDVIALNPGPFLHVTPTKRKFPPDALKAGTVIVATLDVVPAVWLRTNWGSLAAILVRRLQIREVFRGFCIPSGTQESKHLA